MMKKIVPPIVAPNVGISIDICHLHLYFGDATSKYIWTRFYLTFKI